jgi:hypothetical protein
VIKTVSISRRRFLAYVVASFLVGVLATIGLPRLLASAGDRVLPLHLEEIGRVSSPDGRVDAVMIRDNCGPLCSFGYSVFLVPRGEAAPEDVNRAIFQAYDMEREALSWKRERVLEIAYEKATISRFRNLSHPFGDFDRKEKNWQYRVEIRLAPTTDSSL